MDEATEQRLVIDLGWMAQARRHAATVRAATSPNPWVGAVVVSGSGAQEQSFAGATQPPGGNHAEIEALAAAGASAQDATMYVTLEPCCHQGRTGPCTEAIIDAGVRRVVVGVEDPDPRVAGRGIAALRAAGVEVEVGIDADAVVRQLAPYIKHRAAGRPFVVLKLAATADGRTAAADGTSKWITGEEARIDAHRLRAESDAVLVGAGTVRADDPELTVRHVDGRNPLRVVLGTVPPGAKVLPALEMSGDLASVLDELGSRDVLQLLVEGGPTVARAFHQSGLVDRYVLYIAPMLMGGADGRPVLDGPGAATLDEAWRGRIVDVTRVGADVRLEMEPA